jgi:transcriptional regulator with PAS, ATPase and Fis domain
MHLIVIGPPPPTAGFEGDRGAVLSDRKMLEIEALLEKVAPSTLPILLLGETGVGKEVLAERIHALSGRTGPFIALNCAALTETLIESEIFGHEAGAFTGALRTKQGLLESANGGTVLIDEVGELPSAMQVKLLRVLETKQVTRVGALRGLSIDVRFVAATNRDLDTEVQAGRFRRDLYFRLAGTTIAIPPLRERRSDIEPLVESFLHQAAADSGRPVPAISQDALRMLVEYAWPGNVRELRHAVERALLLAGDTIFVEHLPPMIAGGPLAAAGREEPRVLRSEVRALERDAILSALERCAGNQSEAAKCLGISRRTLGERMDIFGIPRPRKRTRA